MRHLETGRNKLLLFLNELRWFYPAGVILAMTILSLFKIDLFRIGVSIGKINFKYRGDTVAMDNRNVKEVMKYLLDNSCKMLTVIHRSEGGRIFIYFIEKDNRLLVLKKNK